MKRTLLLKNDSKDIYGAMFKYFSLQGYEIAEQIHNKRLSVLLVRVTTFWYWFIGVILFILGIFPSIPWFINARGKITIDLESSPEGTYVVAELEGQKAHKAFNYLVGILSMLPEGN